MNEPAFEFHQDDVAHLIGPQPAFVLGSEETPGVYALQHHLALEIVGHLSRDNVPFVFRGGTALHTRLPERRRFSIDVDITTTDLGAVHQSLRGLVSRFPNSPVTLAEPPRDLRIEGVCHVLTFGNIRILVEVVEAPSLTGDLEPLRLIEAELDWQVEVPAPTCSAFVGQKLAVLGPNTVGKAVGLNERHARGNQGVCKQIFDLRELLRREDLDPEAIHRAYGGAVDEANLLRGTTHARAACLTDARELLSLLQRPRTNDKAQEIRYGLWAGYRASKRWIASRADWQDEDYRVAAGVIARLTRELELGPPNLGAIRAPLVAEEVPAEVRERLTSAETQGEAWFVGGEFGGNALVAWAWAP